MRRMVVVMMMMMMMMITMMITIMIMMRMEMKMIMGIFHHRRARRLDDKDDDDDGDDHGGGDGRRRRRRMREGGERKQRSRDDVAVVWFRDGDLRIRDNEALYAAVESGRRVIPLFIWSDEEQGKWGVCGAARFWLSRGLQSLDDDLRQKYGSRLVLVKTNDTTSEIIKILKATKASALFFNASYTPDIMRRDDTCVEEINKEKQAQKRRKKTMQNKKALPLLHPSLSVHRCVGSVLYDITHVEPDKLQGALSHGFGSVGFYLRACQRLGDPKIPKPPPSAIPPPVNWPKSLTHLQMGLERLPRRSNGERVDWTMGIQEAWRISEDGAHEALRRFLEDGIHHSESKARHRADRKNTAIISPYIRFGQLSPSTVYYEAKRAMGAHRCKAFLRRLAWRDLAYWMLWKFPSLPDLSLRPQYELQRWADDKDGSKLRAWKTGQTGYPLVDAGMRQLWVMGWMPNYIRHVVAGFLIEYLNLSWKHGLEWFHDTLVDSDLAINAHMWQNGGHSGVDQWNFVMHPVYAAKNADPDAEYTRTWVAEVRKLPKEFVHCPWNAPPSVRAQAGFRLGRDYPCRIIANLKAARVDSLKAVNELRASPWGRPYVLSCGNEALELPDGRVARCITRVDYRTNSRQPMTKQVIDDEKWNGRTPNHRRDNNPLAVAMRDCVARSSRAAELMTS
uniref:Photolyase/cryptochrome alpha/beta domain-containing protein n=1 Tax=Lotharella globosa TaxID=91324 RepID=A0A7S4DSM3_9EUKA